MTKKKSVIDIVDIKTASPGDSCLDVENIRFCEISQITHLAHYIDTSPRKHM